MSDVRRIAPHRSSRRYLDLVVALDEVAYQPIRTFEEWATTLEDEPDWTNLHDAVEALRRTRELVGAPDEELSLRQSLLLAALHTGAIEGIHRMNRGVTLTALDHITGWQQVVEDAEGTSARRHVEAALNAYDLAVDAIGDDAPPVTEAWIRRIHEEACAAQDTVPVRTAVGEQLQPFRRGEYKREANHVLLRDGRMHWYAPPDSVAAEMHRFTQELRSPAFASSHPVVQAAYSHHALTQIHPFQDGNGRVARVLASMPLLRWTSVPFHLYEDQVAEYFDALAAADAGAPVPFVGFVRERVHDLVLLTNDRLIAEAPVEDTAARHRELAVATAKRLHEEVTAQLNAVVDNYSWLPGVVGRVDEGRWALVVASRDEAGRRVVDANRVPQLSVEFEGLETQSRSFPTYVDVSLENDYPLAVGPGGRAHQLELRLADMHPEVSIGARTRLDAYLRRAVRELLGQVMND